MGRPRKADAAWTFKDRVRQRDGHKCTKCGISQEQYQKVSGRRLDVHRLVPGSPYTMEGCITVCKGCHDRIHSEIGKSPRSKSTLVLKMSPLFARKVRLYCAINDLTHKKLLQKLVGDAVAESEARFPKAYEFSDMAELLKAEAEFTKK